ncbi:hypothetical protein Amsp01_090270 [Amycolatopsis sp. NBRC 101858]|nr:hypothetical protein Amsp01_090270 [Amycolatopsis sp. NBRC 101858]
MDGPVWTVDAVTGTSGSGAGEPAFPSTPESSGARQLTRRGKEVVARGLGCALLAAVVRSDRSAWVASVPVDGRPASLGEVDPFFQCLLGAVGKGEQLRRVAVDDNDQVVVVIAQNEGKFFVGAKFAAGLLAGARYLHVAARREPSVVLTHGASSRSRCLGPVV